MPDTPKPARQNPQWTTEGPNILSEENLARVEQAVSEVWIGGIHFYYCAGCSPDDVVFSDFNAFLAHVTASRPGDLFKLWSVAEMRRKEQLLADRAYQIGSTSDSLLSAADLDRVQRYLREGKLNEILSFVFKGTGNVETFWSDIDSSDMERFLEAAQRAAVPGGRLCVLPLARIDKPEFYLVKAKRPNEHGQVPIGGPY